MKAGNAGEVLLHADAALAMFKKSWALKCYFEEWQ